MLTSRAVFAYHLARTAVLNGNNDSTGCVRGGREEYAILISFLYICVFLAIQALSASFNALSLGNSI